MDMTEPLIDVRRLEAVLEAFANERGWGRFHSPKNLAMALTGEVGELVEIFQWMTEEESRGVGRDPRTAAAVRNELADVCIYLVRLAGVLGLDLNEAVEGKVERNRGRFPVE